MYLDANITVLNASGETKQGCFTKVSPEEGVVYVVSREGEVTMIKLSGLREPGKVPRLAEMQNTIKNKQVAWIEAYGCQVLYSTIEGDIYLYDVTGKTIL